MRRLWREFPGRPDRARAAVRAHGGEFIAPYDVQRRIDDPPPAIVIQVDEENRTITISGGVPGYKVFGSVDRKSVV